MTFAEKSTTDTVLELRAVSKRFGDVAAVTDLSLSVQQGEILALLGPSGCGKTTTLRMVAGLEDPTDGEIFYDGRIVASAVSNTFVPPNKRNMGMVFQSYALWPHMTVYENIAHPLKLRGQPKSEIRERILSILDTVGMRGLESRPIPKLSGGQQQRVALARAIIYEPKMLLLDEPFSNLDAQLRTQMRIELRTIQRRLGMTTLFVTHDQVEALSIADRIAVIDDGRLIQVGTPQEVYRQPATKVVRDFLGRVIIFSGRVTTIGENEAAVEFDGIDGDALLVRTTAAGLVAGANVEVSIRPEDVVVKPVSDGAARGGQNSIRAQVDTLLFVGDHWEGLIRFGQKSVLLHLPHTVDWKESQQVDLVFPPASLQLWIDPTRGGACS